MVHLVRVAVLLLVLLAPPLGGALPKSLALEYPSADFPSLADAISAAQQGRGGGKVVVEPGKHLTTPEKLTVGTAPPLRVLDRSAGVPMTLVGASYGTRGARGGEGEVRIAGSWDLDGGDAWNACRGLEYDADVLAAGDDPEGVEIGTAGRGGDFPYGEVVMCEGWRGGDGGLLQNVALVNHRSEESPYGGVGVLTVMGGEWELLECEIAGCGTGQAAPALIQLGGEEEGFKGNDFPELGVEALRPCRAPLLRMRNCLVHEEKPRLPVPDDAHGDEVDTLIYVSAHATLDCQDSELRGGLTSAVSVFGTSVTFIKGTVIHGCGVAFEVDDFCSLSIRDSIIRDNLWAFKVWTEGASVELQRNHIIGDLYADADRFVNASLVERDNKLLPLCEPDRFVNASLVERDNKLLPLGDLRTPELQECGECGAVGVPRSGFEEDIPLFNG